MAIPKFLKGLNAVGAGLLDNGVRVMVPGLTRRYTAPGSSGAAIGYDTRIELDYDATSGSIDEAFAVFSRTPANIAGTLGKAFWLNEQGMPRATPIFKNETTFKFFSFVAATTTKVITVQDPQSGGGALRWAINGLGQVVLGAAETIAGAVVGLTDAASVPANLPAGTILLRDTKVSKWDGSTETVVQFTNIERLDYTFNTVANAVGTAKVPIKGGTFAIETVAIAAASAAASGTLFVDVNKNGSTIYGTQANRPSITTTSTNGIGSAGAHTATTVTDGDWLTLDMEGTYTGVTGPVVVSIRLRRTA